MDIVVSALFFADICFLTLMSTRSGWLLFVVIVVVVCLLLLHLLLPIRQCSVVTAATTMAYMHHNHCVHFAVQLVLIGRNRPKVQASIVFCVHAWPTCLIHVTITFMAYSLRRTVYSLYYLLFTT